MAQRDTALPQHRRDPRVGEAREALAFVADLGRQPARMIADRDEARAKGITPETGEAAETVCRRSQDEAGAIRERAKPVLTRPLRVEGGDGPGDDLGRDALVRSRPARQQRQEAEIGDRP